MTARAALLICSLLCSAAAAQHEADLAGLVHQADLSSAVTPTLIPLIFGASNPQSSADALVQSLQRRP